MIRGDDHVGRGVETQRLEGGEQTESEPGVYRWREINRADLSQIELEALSPKVMTLHRLMVRRTS